MVNELKEKVDVENLFKNAGDKLVVMDFYAVWCGPCEDIKPFFVELSSKYTNVVFAKVDVDNTNMEETVAKYEVNCMPTFVFVKGGKVLERLEGANRQKLEETVKKYA